MAIILILISSAIGFASAVTAFVAFDASLLQALALWMSGGLFSVVVILLQAVLPTARAATEEQAVEVA